MHTEFPDYTIFKFKKIKSAALGSLSSIFLVLLIFSLSAKSFSQSTSFQVVLDSVGYRMQDIAVNEVGESILFMRKYPNTVETNCYLLPVAEAGGAVQGIEIPNVQPNYIIHAEYYSDRVIFIAYSVAYSTPGTPSTTKSIIFNMDLTSGNKWSKYLNGQIRQNKFSTDKNGDVFIANTPFDIFDIDLYDGHTSVLELFKLDEAGNTIWKKGLLMLDSLSVEYPDFFIMDMALDEDSNIYVMGLCGNLFPPADIIKLPYIMKFDSTGHPLLLKTLAVENHYFSSIEVTTSGVLLLSHAPNNPNLYNSGVYQDKYAKLIKLDHDLDFLWGKQYSGENFPYYSAGIKEMPNGNLLMSHSTFGAYPAVLTEMDAEGNILTQKGFPNYQPQIAVLNDGSFLITSEINYNDAGETFHQPVIAKTDTFGEIEGCENYPTCIVAEDYTVELGTFNYDTVGIPDLEDFDTLVQPVDFSFSKFCGFPPLPTPAFTLPDTLCLGQTATALATNNRFANAHEWNLTGPGVDITETDSFDFRHRYNVAGEYLLRQTVWVLGCAYEEEKNVTVLPPLEATISPEYICPEGPAVLEVEASRPLRHFAWGSGQETSEIEVPGSGSYSVTVSDGHCSASDSAEITFVADLLGQQAAISLPEDTTVCRAHLPFEVRPESPFGVPFFMYNPLPDTGHAFSLADAGQFIFGLEAYGCHFEARFELGVSDCAASIYFPTVFSPNGDGINDGFFPQGIDFEAIELTVYDRWGGLRHRGRGDELPWSPGKAMNEGMYLYHFRYRNLETGKEETLSGEVTLLR